MDHDGPFKQLLTTFFIEFLELFVPELAAVIQPTSIEFLDKEIFTDVTSTERHEVDLLAKAKFLDEQDAFFLIHVENQATAQEQFVRRMFRYFARLTEKHSVPVFPIALFSYDQPFRPEPDRFQIDFPGLLVLDFGMKVIQLNRLNWRDYVRQSNPVASALMVKMNIPREDRPRVKLECLRMLVTLKLDRARASLITTFMNSYLKLTTAEAVVYNQEREKVDPPEREAIMVLTNEWIEEGRDEGRREAHAEHRRSNEKVVRRLLALERVDASLLLNRLDQLDSVQLQQLVDRLIDSSVPFDPDAWLKELDQN
jgi:hypothetical protein